jgi:accessory gene regulator protein AgrB
VQRSLDLVTWNVKPCPSIKRWQLFITGLTVDAWLHPRCSRLLPTRERSEFSNSANRQASKYFLLFSTGLKTVLSLLSALFKFVYTIKYSKNAEISTLLPAGGHFRGNFFSLHCKVSQLEPLLSHLLPVTIIYIMFFNSTNSLKWTGAQLTKNLPTFYHKPRYNSQHLVYIMPQTKPVHFLTHYSLTIRINIILHYSMYVRNSGKLKGRDHQADLDIDKR